MTEQPPKRSAGLLATVAEIDAAIAANAQQRSDLEKALAETVQEGEKLMILRGVAVSYHGVSDDDPKGEENKTEAAFTYPWQQTEAGSGKTVAQLIEAYSTDKRSPYHSVAFNTRDRYTHYLRRIKNACGDLKIAAVNAPAIEKLYDEWSGGGKKKAVSHSLITMLRMLAGFGATTLEDDDCVRLSVVLRTMRFEQPVARNNYMDDAQTAEFLEWAHRETELAIALAHAFQYDCKLSQSDVIGVWIPEGEAGISELPIVDGQKWVRGLLWSEIDDNNILRHPGYPEIDLNKCPNVRAELTTRYPWEGREGPVIKDKDTGLPFRLWTYQRKWREIADKAGIPKDIRVSRVEVAVKSFRRRQSR